MDGENLSVSVEVEPDILNMKDEDSVSFFLVAILTYNFALSPRLSLPILIIIRKVKKNTFFFIMIFRESVIKKKNIKFCFRPSKINK